jgi:hypothetical protein
VCHRRACLLQLSHVTKPNMGPPVHVRRRTIFHTIDPQCVGKPSKAIAIPTAAGSAAGRLISIAPKTFRAIGLNAPTTAPASIPPRRYTATAAPSVTPVRRKGPSPRTSRMRTAIAVKKQPIYKPLAIPQRRFRRSPDNRE